MKLYRLCIVNGDILLNLNIKANSLSQASLIARNKFISEYGMYENIQIQLIPSDLYNHIDEIMERIYRE